MTTKKVNTCLNVLVLLIKVRQWWFFFYKYARKINWSLFNFLFDWFLFLSDFAVEVV